MRRRSHPRSLALAVLGIAIAVAVLGAPRAAHPVAASPPPPPPTVTLTEHATLTTNQSMFGPGGTPVPNLSATLFNASWNPDPVSGGSEAGSSIDFCYPEDQIPGVPSCYQYVKFGGKFSASSTGQIGMSAQLTNGTGGTVGVNYPVSVSFTYPKPNSFAPGDTVTVQTAASLDTSQQASITSVYPTWQNAELDGTLGFTANVSGEVCVFSCGSFDLFPPINIPTISGQIFSLPTSELTEVPGLGVTGHCFNVADNVALGLGSVPVDISNPCKSSASNGQYTANGYIFEPSVKLTTTANADGSLTATGCDTYLAVPISSVAWLKRFITLGTDTEFPTGFPNLGPFTAKGFSLGYKAFDVAFTTTDTECQTLSFKPQIQITLQFPQSLTYQVEDAAGNPIGAQQTGTSATVLAGNKIAIVTPHDNNSTLSLTPVLSFTNDSGCTMACNFSNAMTHTVAESAHLTIGVLNFSFPDNPIGFDGFDLGPIYDNTWPLTSTTGSLFSRSFTLAGFTTPSVGPVPLTPDPRPAPQPTTVHPVEGAPFSGVVAGFADPDTSESGSGYSASIDWGDGTPATAGSVTGTGGQYSVSGSHAYEEEGSYTVKVTLQDSDLATLSSEADSTAVVADAALTGSGTATTPATGGKTVLLWPASAPTGIVATFTDADPHGAVADYTAAIDWGDGQSTKGIVAAGSNGTFTVTGTHTYAQLGFYTVTTQISDAGGSKTSATTIVLTFAAPPSGNFAVGSANAKQGATVNFWGPQWWKNNPGGGSSAPAAFKGYVTAPAGPTGCATPATIFAAPGDSGNPPASVPAFMAVLVTNPAQVTQSGATISGPVTGVVVVQTNPGYGPAVGAAGTGTVIASVCGS